MDQFDIIEEIRIKPEVMQTVIRSLAKGAELINALQDEINKAENEQLLYYGAAIGL